MRRSGILQPDEAAVPNRPRGKGSGMVRLLTATVYHAGFGAVLLCLGGGGLLTGAVTAFLAEAQPIPEMERYRPPEMTTLVDSRGHRFASMYEERRKVLPIREMPKHLTDAFLAIEDADFRQHLGANPKAMLRAALVNATRGGSAQGASTITQQVPRNLIRSVGREKTLERKIHEGLVALQLERLYSKDQILEVYLNQIYLGAGCYGVEAASQRYFGKSARDVTIAEAALLAGLPQLPERYSPVASVTAAKTRRDQVLVRLNELGWISTDEYLASLSTSVEPPRPDNAPPGAAYFADAVRREVSGNEGLGDQALREAGLRIDTTFDPVAQELAQQALRRGLEREEKEWLSSRATRWSRFEPLPRADLKPGVQTMARVVRVYRDQLVVELADGIRGTLKIPGGASCYFTEEAGVTEGEGVDVEIRAVQPRRNFFRGDLLPDARMQGAVVCLDSRTGAARALVGGVSFFDSRNNGMYNRALQARRQAGSTFKPLFYCAALECGWRPDSPLLDAPITFANGYSPQNYERKFYGASTLQVALEHSRNASTVRLASIVGLRRMLEHIRKFDLLPGGPHWNIPMEYPVVLGTEGVTPLELAAAYLPFANGGQVLPPHLVTGVRTSDNRDVTPPEERVAREVLRPAVAAWMVQMLKGVFDHGTAAPLRAALPEDLQDRVAGKTGTTSDNRDAWLVGFTPFEVVVVWVGFDHPIPLGDGRTGGKVAGPIWVDFVSELWQTRTPSERSEGLVMPAGWRLLQGEERWIAVGPGDPQPSSPLPEPVEAASSLAPDQGSIEEPAPIVSGFVMSASGQGKAAEDR